VFEFTVDDDHKYAIPAASIGNTDLVSLARTNPDAAREIERLAGLMNRGEETKQEFRHLCQLLFDVGSVSAAEILLRRNADHYEGRALYAQLFGTAKQDEFESAIEAFKSQFNLELMLAAKNDFLVSTFHTDGGPPRSDAFALLSGPCEIKIGYIEENKVEANVTLLDPARDVFDADENMLLFFVQGVWEIAYAAGA
jgi:hypothetical protein